jgi:CHAD domain-containing protein
MRLDAETLDRTPDEGARIVALDLCASAEEAARRAGAGGDPEALHDFRVAVRRLRSALRAFRPLLGDAVSGKDRRRLRRQARATGPARDAEVLLAWFREAPGSLPERWRPALGWLASRVEGAKREGYAALEAEVVPDFARLAPSLAQRLAAGGASRAPSGAETFGAALAGLARTQARALKEALGRISVAADAGPAHRARIEAKRLRYLLEPLRGNARADAADAVKGLRELQDVLGGLADAHRAEAEIGAALVVAAAERARRRDGGDPGPDPRPGLLALQRMAGERVQSLFGKLEGGWLQGGATRLLDQVFEVVAGLEWRDAEEAEPEQRLLLSDLPPEALGESEEQEQGWLPGGRESFGVVRAPGGERFFRASLQGKAGRRFEVAEDIGRREFEEYWPLTEGRRVRRRRHRPAADPAWCFDEYLDRKLVLAVSTGVGSAVPPQWLEPVFVRDVTSERGYADESLARRGGGRGKP